jgi:beta-glucosidase-like glycosyl hydrolase
MVEAAIGAIKAGCDILLLCGPAANSKRVFDALLREADCDANLAFLIEKAAKRVLDSKQNLGLLNAAPGLDCGASQFDELRRDIDTFSKTLGIHAKESD